MKLSAAAQLVACVPTEWVIQVVPKYALFLIIMYVMASKAVKCHLCFKWLHLFIFFFSSIHT
jgi:hypothetical protein